MGSFLIKSVSGGGSLEFHDCRVSDDEYRFFDYGVKLVNANLSAMIEVRHDLGDPAAVFRQVAERWKGWEGELVWGSLEGELTLRFAQDRAGHVTIGVGLRSRPHECDWSIQATIIAEAGQLEDLARRAKAFFGGLGSRTAEE